MGKYLLKFNNNNDFNEISNSKIFIKTHNTNIH